MKRTPEQEAARKVRSIRERSFPKCGCGNVLSIATQERGGERCGRCETAQTSGPYFHDNNFGADDVAVEHEGGAWVASVRFRGDASEQQRIADVIVRALNAAELGSR